MKHLKCLFGSPNLSRYKYKICGIKSATDRCKYNISIPVEVELKNSYKICKKNSTSSTKVIYSKMFLYSRQNKYNLNKNNLLIFGK